MLGNWVPTYQELSPGCSNRAVVPVCGGAAMTQVCECGWEKTAWRPWSPEKSCFLLGDSCVGAWTTLPSEDDWWSAPASGFPLCLSPWPTLWAIGPAGPQLNGFWSCLRSLPTQRKDQDSWEKPQWPHYLPPQTNERAGSQLGKLSPQFGKENNGAKQ